jgi:hypothetical protein
MRVTRRLIRVSGLAAALAGLAVVAAACSSVAPSIGQYAVVTGQGAFSDQQVKQVVDPGVRAHVGSGDTIWYLPAQVRNYVTAPSGGDRSNPQAELTGANTAPGKTSPGMLDYTWSYVAFELNPAITNPDHKVINSFFPFCLKYGCATQTAQTTSGNSSLTRSSAPGWLNMLAEIFPHAIDNATHDAIGDFGPNLWSDNAEWTSFGNDIAKRLPGALANLDGSGSTPYFCGPGSTQSKCQPFTVIVNNVTPADSSVVTAYNQEVAAAYAAQAGTERLNAAKEIYGPDANWALALLDMISACKAAKVPCNIYAGNPPVHP